MSGFDRHAARKSTVRLADHCGGGVISLHETPRRSRPSRSGVWDYGAAHGVVLRSRLSEDNCLLVPQVDAPRKHLLSRIGNLHMRSEDRDEAPTLSVLAILRV